MARRRKIASAAGAPLLIGLLAMHSVPIGAAESRVGMVDQPCPAPLELPPKLREKLVSLFLDTRMLTAEDFGKLLSDPEMIQFNDENQQRARQDWPGLCRYRADNVRVMSQPKPPRMVFIGDSITENWRLADPAFFNHDVVNRGISGQTTAQMLVRFRADVIALRPKIVHILGGTNDIAGNTGPTSPQDFKNQIMSMVEMAQSNGIEVVLGSIPPAASFPWRAEVQPAPIVKSLNAWLKEYAASKNLSYIDYHAALAGPSGELRSDLGNDGVHPNRNGYEVMRGLISPPCATAEPALASSRSACLKP